MVTNIDKALYQLPVGMSEDVLEAEPIEIEIDDPEEVTIGIDGIEINLEPMRETQRPSWKHFQHKVLLRQRSSARKRRRNVMRQSEFVMT
jgi:hypothetical protein